MRRTGAKRTHGRFHGRFKETPAQRYGSTVARKAAGRTSPWQANLRPRSNTKPAFGGLMRSEHKIGFPATRTHRPISSTAFLHGLGEKQTFIARPSVSVIGFKSVRSGSSKPYKLHLGERSNDLKRPPTASCRHCQASALSFVGFLPGLCFNFLLLGRRVGDAAGMILALAFCQCWSAIFLTVSGLVD
jgi:hypothetical protein